MFTAGLVDERIYRAFGVARSPELAIIATAHTPKTGGKLVTAILAARNERTVVVPALQGAQMMTVVSLFAVTIDCPDPLSLARFYQKFTGGQLLASNEDFIVLTTDDNIRLDFQRVANHRPPPWSDPAAPRRLYPDFRVDNLDQAQAHLLNLGAVRLEFQPGGQRFRVFLDPDGHPFCIATNDAATALRTSPAQQHDDWTPA